MTRASGCEEIRAVLSDYLGTRAGDRLLLFVDAGREWLGMHLDPAAQELDVKCVITTVNDGKDLDRCRDMLSELTGDDVVVAAFSGGSPLPYHAIFPHFRSPAGFSGRSAFIRPRIPDRVLLTMLSTGLAEVEQRVGAVRRALGSGGHFRLTSPGGTDLEVKMRPPEVLPYRAGPDGGHAYLPPAEIYTGVVPGSASGIIVVDVTAGEFVVEGQIVDRLGLVDSPVLVTVSGGIITSIDGGDIARRLAACLDGQDDAFKLVVEVGFGLSRGEPTGLISVDECLAHTGHVGVGNDLFFGGNNDVPMHLDLVVHGLTIESMERCGACG